MLENIQTFDEKWQEKKPQGQEKNNYFVKDLSVKLKEIQKTTIAGMQTTSLFDDKVLTFRGRHLCYGK